MCDALCTTRGRRGTGDQRLRAVHFPQTTSHFSFHAPPLSVPMAPGQRRTIASADWMGKLEEVKVSKESLNRLVMNYLVIEVPCPALCCTAMHCRALQCTTARVMVWGRFARGRGYCMRCCAAEHTNGLWQRCPSTCLTGQWKGLQSGGGISGMLRSRRWVMDILGEQAPFWGA